MNLYSFFTNNIIINNLLIAAGLDFKKEMAAGQWKAFKYDEGKTIQQNAGFSHTTEVEESLEKVKSGLVYHLDKYVSKKSKVLDFGCGPGIYMKLISNNYIPIGIDVSENMLKAAASSLPGCKLYLGNFLNVKFEETFGAIYSISVLEYVPVSQINNFFKKCAGLLNDKGIIFIQYPHALSRKDLYYPDRNYINYSPQRIDKIAGRYFNIISHRQSYSEKEVCLYDKEPYSTNSKTFKNGYLLIAQKK